MDKTKAFEVVSTQGWLAHMPADFRSKFLALGSMRTAEAGRVLFEAGDFNSSFIGLADGVIEIYWYHPQLSFHLIHFARSGFWIGEGLAFGLPTRLVSARTKTKTCMICVPRKKVEELVAEDPSCLVYFGRLTMLHVEACLKTIGELMYRDPLVRVSARLVTMCEPHFAPKLNQTMTLNVTQDELAILSNMSRKSLNRALSVLRAAGAVEPHYGYVTILDLEKLMGIASARVHVSPFEGAHADGESLSELERPDGQNG